MLKGTSMSINFEDEIRKIINEELSGLIDHINECFLCRCKNKKHNFLLGNFDDKVKANMVFVSCFESQIGNRIENICREIAKLRYGTKNVPQKISNVDTEFKLNAKKQYIQTNIDYKFVTGQIFEKLDPNNKYSSQKVKTLFDDITITRKGNCKLLVDLAFYDENNELNIFELKAGGMLDSSKAKSDLAKLLGLYITTDNPNTHVYFATIYNFNGEDNNWDGSPSRFFENDLLLIGKDFWNKILPNGVNFEKFVEIYNEIFEKLEINKKMQDLIDRIMEQVRHER